MKKRFLITALIITFVTLFLSGCADSVYSEDWYVTPGYIEYEQDQFSLDSIVYKGFTKGTNPTSDRRVLAKKWEHSYDTTPRGYFIEEKWNPATLEYDEMIKYPIKITKDIDDYTVPGIIYYCDDKDVYIINNKYRFDLWDHKDKTKNSDYRFVIDINGIRDLVIQMDYQPSSIYGY